MVRHTFECGSWTWFLPWPCVMGINNQNSSRNVRQSMYDLFPAKVSMVQRQLREKFTFGVLLLCGRVAHAATWWWRGFAMLMLQYHSFIWVLWKFRDICSTSVFVIAKRRRDSGSPNSQYQFHVSRWYKCRAGKWPIVWQETASAQIALPAPSCQSALLSKWQALLKQ